MSRENRICFSIEIYFVVCYYLSMQIIWEKIDKSRQKIINSWLSVLDKHNLCMEQKSWEQTASDINCVMLLCS